MTKRRLMNEKQIKDKKRQKPRLKLAEAPPINNIQDLIEIGQSPKFYKNLDSIMLWRITPYLQELESSRWNEFTQRICVLSGIYITYKECIKKIKKKNIFIL